MTRRAEEDREERRTALRALLGAPFVDAGDPEYALVRRHERELASTLQSTYGYRLEVASTAARAAGPPTPAGAYRPLRIRPSSASGRRRSPDDWPALCDRGCALLLLTLAALERGGAQTAIAELARGIEQAGADVDPPVVVEFRERAERVAFADGLDLLCAWGVLTHTSGSHNSYAREQQTEDEALFTVDRRRLALLLRDPAAALAATSLDQLLDESKRHSPTPEGENRRRYERLARALTEDPAVVLADLDADERSYFLGQRARIEDAVEDATGYVVERRSEGSALIVDDRAFTDAPFPTDATVKQVALLLCDTLAAVEPGCALSAEALRDAVSQLVVAHGSHWDRDAEDAAQLSALTEATLDVLLAGDLACRTDTGGIEPRPLAARFRGPTLRAGGATR